MVENFVSCGCAESLISLYVDLEKIFTQLFRKKKESAKDWIIITRGAASSVENACNVRLDNFKKKLFDAYKKVENEKWVDSHLELIEAQDELDAIFKGRICPR